MDPNKFTTIAHSSMRILGPVASERLDRLIDVLELRSGARVLDLGTGKGETLIRIAERYGANGVGVDANAVFVDAARAEASGRAMPGALALVHQDAREYEAEPESFDLVICAGARPWGGMRDTLERLITLTRPGGQILVGEGYWLKRPDPEYLALLDCPEDDQLGHAGHIDVASELGLVPLYTSASSREEFDHYEGRYWAAVERWLAKHPEDPDAPAIRERITKWRSGYLRWGRSTLGYAYYLYLKPA